ncbi:ADP-ribosyltransferase [Streptococcus pseudoporcinus]|uniref:Clostridial binary toxin A n=1 Tax=Streptococcus pseudoporcinus LQ 940-04 TaxID=875093 RepID=G5K6L0_9STRE|nr:ADP-ribosyltransferase [Streptococcus pseudoporcinus]EFR44805.1 clostridial binary toxin A [Streptococcus pseudoporcinus SPIN 20026]EHI65805.1 clostridial binary toxin A [Streptococcus pseudoporcinus LQ 940-04]VEF94563.1 ADP-ribosyltransferase [Streptococcus pseudoporcinus]
MNQKCKTIILLPFMSLFFFIGQSTVFSQHYYDEADSVVFDGDSAYFKFTDSEVTKYIINKRWANKTIFTEEEKKAIQDYTCEQSVPINGQLDKVKGDLSQLTPEMKRQAQLLDSATQKMTIPWDIISYRYVYTSFLLDLGFTQDQLDNCYANGTFNPKVLDKFVPGAQYTKYSFMSTTAVKNGAMIKRPIELRIRVKRGAKAAFVEPYSWVPSELELLFPRGSQLEVIGAYLSDDDKKLNIEVKLKSSD